MMFTAKYLEKLAYDEAYVADKKKIKRLLLKARRCDDKRLIDDSLIELFKSMHRVLIKHINNYYFLCRNFQSNDKLEDQELISEFYLVFVKCVYNFNQMDDCFAFFWYYDKSLSWRSLRMIKKNVKPNANNLSITFSNEDGDTEEYDLPQDSDLNFTELEMDVLGFTILQKELTISRMQGYRVQDFVKDKGISTSVYYKELEEIKKKFNNGSKKDAIYNDALAKEQFANIAT